MTISGKVMDENQKGMQSEVRVFKDGMEMKRITTSSIGKFDIELPLNDSLYLSVTSDGYVSKTVLADTHVPDKKTDKDYQFPCFIDLYPVGDVPTYVDLERPVGKIVFEGRQFVYDLAFTQKANRNLRQFINERKKMNVKPIGKDK